MEPYSANGSGLACPIFLCAGHGQDVAVEGFEKRLEVVVVYTDVPGTAAALQMAGQLAERLEAQIRLVVPYEVPYALPLTQPPVSADFLENRIHEVASRSTLGVAAQIYLCRNRRRALEILLKPHSLVVVGGKRRWWRTAAERLAQALREGGHDLLFAEVR